MCERFALYTPNSTIAARYWNKRRGVGDLIGRYNIAPGDSVLAIRKEKEELYFDLARWGFCYSKGPSTLSNVRAEQLLNPEHFREAYTKQRCVIPANGWYAWQTTEAGAQPYYIRPIDPDSRSVVFIAGIWKPAGQGAGIRCAIITEPASNKLAHIHARQPVLLDFDCISDWLDPEITDPVTLKPLVRRFSTEHLTAYAVSKDVNQITNDSASLIEPVN